MGVKNKHGLNIRFFGGIRATCALPSTPSRRDRRLSIPETSRLAGPLHQRNQQLAEKMCEWAGPTREVTSPMFERRPANSLALCITDFYTL
jgi:hypothetical protein